VQGEAQIPWLSVDSHTSEHGLHLIMGTGEAPIHSALVGELALSVAVIALVGKMVATLTTITSGGSAGLLIPSIYFGTMIATIFVQFPRLLGLDAWSFPAMTLVVPAMTASLVSIVNVPLAAIMFAVEGFSGSYLVPAMLALVISTLLAQRNSIYRTQRERVEKRQILPGYGVRRISVPPSWEGQTLTQLDLRRQYEVNVIGWVEQADDAGLPRVRLDADANLPLSASDILVVLGRAEDLNRFTAVVTAAWETSAPDEDKLS
ncbi:MAG: chloride channel protein, partial [Anaerolineales bacterium]|nr:chloride channel protein [Anaerolineales bacterium]